MTRNYIWDLDGTLLDSYEVIVRSICDTFTEFGIPSERDAVHRFVIEQSVGALFAKIAAEYGYEFSTMRERYGEISGERKYEIKLIPHAKEILTNLRDRGDRNFVYTHRGATTVPILEKLGISEFFEETVTILNGFAHKPAPDALDYLVNKYKLDKANTFYVGDRTLDMDCAKNAGIKGILYLQKDGFRISNGSENYIVDDLMKISPIQ